MKFQPSAIRHNAGTVTIKNQTVPVFVINLDRRTDRLAYMADQLDRFGIKWTQVSALDAKTADDDLIAKEVSLTKQRIGMGKGSQCCAITNFDIYRKMVAENIPAAVIMQDDIEISKDICSFLTGLDWVPDNIGLVQFEKFGRRVSKRLAGPPVGLSPVKGRAVRRLYSRTAGAGCYLITRSAAEYILENKPLLDIPIDHLLFSPNVSSLFDGIGVAIVVPALAVQKMEDFASDISAERARRPKNLATRLYRLWQESNKIPHQILRIARGARMIEYGYSADVTVERSNATR